MENSKSSRSGRTGYLVWLSLGICLLLQIQHTHAGENKTDPTDNVNLTPFRQWRSAYYCLQLKGPDCSAFENVSLTDKGILDVFPGKVGEYCTSGCSKHVLDVLTCIHYVKKDFWFANKATVSVLNKAIHDGCSNQSQTISTVGWKNSGMKMLPTMYIPIVASLSTLFFIGMFNL